LFRIEPFTTCSFNCIYCYARWYREDDSVKPRFRALNEFRVVARKLNERKLRTIPFRLSTLSDPFQPLESKVKIVRNILKIALEYEIPLIINTKSNLIMDDSIKKLILKLGSKNLVLIQISISTLNNNISSKLEPKASPPYERLKIIENLSKENIPVAVRLQPYIPGISDYPNLEDTIRSIKDIGALHLIVESIRLPKRDIIELENILHLKLDLWEPYQVTIPSSLEDVALYRLSYNIRHRIFRELANLARRYNLFFATCKEGFFHLHSSPDCCGIFLLSGEKCIVRPTLNEVYVLVKKYGTLTLDEVISRLKDLDVLFDEKLKPYPKRLKKPLRNHEKKFIRVLRNSKILHHITPSLTYHDGKVVLRSSF